MAKIFDDSNTRHECSACLGTGLGNADGIPCWHCKGSGQVDNRPELEDYQEDERRSRR